MSVSQASSEFDDSRHKSRNGRDTDEVTSILGGGGFLPRNQSECEFNDELKSARHSCFSRSDDLVFFSTEYD